MELSPIAPRYFSALFISNIRRHRCICSDKSSTWTSRDLFYFHFTCRVGLEIQGVLLVPVCLGLLDYLYPRHTLSLGSPWRPLVQLTLEALDGHKDRYCLDLPGEISRIQYRILSIQLYHFHLNC